MEQLAAEKQASPGDVAGEAMLHVQEAHMLRAEAVHLGNWAVDLANWAAEVARLACPGKPPEFTRVRGIEYAQAMLRGYRAPGADPAEWAQRLAAALSRLLADLGEEA